MTHVTSRIAVTGASGFIGGRLMEKLCLDHTGSVVAVLRASSPRYFLAPFPYEVRTADLSEAASLQTAFAGCDALVHCAFDFSPPDRSGLIETNLVALYNVMQAARSAGIQKVVYISSAAVYGYRAGGVIDENTPDEVEPDPYAEAKQRAEALLRLLPRYDGPTVAILQPGIVYGPRATWTTSFAERARRGRLVLPGDGSGICNAVYVDDVVTAILAALAHLPDVHLRRYLVVGPAPCMWREYASYFVEASGQNLVREDTWNRQQRRAQQVAFLRKALGGVYSSFFRQRGSGRFIRTLRTWAHRALPPVYSDDAEFPVFASQAVYSGQRAQSELGYAPNFNLDRGMALTIGWLRWVRLLPESHS